MKIAELNESMTLIHMCNNVLIERDDEAAGNECRGVYDRRGGYVGGNRIEGTPRVWHVRHSAGSQPCSSLSDAIACARQHGGTRVVWAR